VGVAHIHGATMTVRAKSLEDAPDFRAFFLEHHGFVRRCTLRFGLRDEQADDAVQEVFLVAHRRLDDFDLGAPCPFLRGVAWRVCANLRRRQAVRDRRGADVPVETVEGGEESDERVLKRERARLVRACLGQMDRTRSEAFEMMVVEGMAATDVARALAISTHAVYRHVRAAKAAVGAAIKQHERGGVAS